MAITCVSTITSIYIPNKIVRISADITVDTGPTHTVVMENADISTSAKKTEAANIIWAKFQKKYAEEVAQAGIATEITNLQGTLNTNIEGRTP